MVVSEDTPENMYDANKWNREECLKALRDYAARQSERVRELGTTNSVLNKQNQRILSELKAVERRLQEMAKWIPVSERLPEDGGDLVLVNVDRSCNYEIQMRDIGWHDDRGWHRRAETKQPGSVTHWMPLPEPPCGLDSEQAKAKATSPDTPSAGQPE
jgi:hypothetical protein